MPYIKYPSLPDSLGDGREARDAAVHPATGAWVAEVDSVAPGENAVDAKEHADTVAAAEAYAVANPRVDIIADAPPSAVERLAWRISEIVRLNKLIESDSPPPMEARR